MEQTKSYLQVFPQTLLEKYEFAEVRNAAATLQGTSPEEFAQIAMVLEEFSLNLSNLTEPGGSKGEIAKYLDLQFRKLGWREAKHSSKTTFTLRLSPYRAAGERRPKERTQEFTSEGHMVDNVRGRIALDVEWNATADFTIVDPGDLVATERRPRCLWSTGSLPTSGEGSRITKAAVRTAIWIEI